MVGNLAGANASAKKQDNGLAKGGTTQPCEKAVLRVTVVRGGAGAGKNFSNDILLERKGTTSSAKKPCDKVHEFGGLDPGQYEVSAVPATGAGYSCEKVLTVSLAAGDKKDVEIELLPNEVIEVRPNNKTSLRQYVNLADQAGQADRGQSFELTAHLKHKVAGVTVYWDLELHKDNGKYLNTVINGPMHRFKVTTKSQSDSEGIAKAKLELGHFGGNKVRVLASLSSDVAHPSAAAKKSDEFVVWRKHWYQLSYSETAALPSRAGLTASFDKVFLASEEADETKFKKATYAKHYRPAWMFSPGAGDTDKLCVGTHNIDVFGKLYKAPAAGAKPKSHIILCDWQFDAKGSAGGLVSDEIVVVFEDGDPAEQAASATHPSFHSSLVGVFSPPLLDGTKLLVVGKWFEVELDATGAVVQVGGNPKITAQGNLADNEVRLDKGRASNDELMVKLPQGATVDATHAVVVRLQVSFAHGTYLGWAEAPHHTVVILNMSADDLNDVINHEIGHLFGQTPPQANAAAHLPAHPKMYQQRGGSGTHCAEGATWTPDATEVPQLNPATAGELDAQGNASGAYSGGTCIMFGIGNAGKRQFCEHCAAQLKARDLSAFG